MNRCYEEKVGEKKRKKGVEDKIKNQVEDKRWKDMEKTKKKEDNIMEEKQMMDRDKIKKGKGNHKEWEVKRKKEKGKHVESKKKADDKTQQKYHEEKKEIVKYTKDEDNQEKYALKHAEKLTKSKEDVKVNETIPQFCILISPEDITGKLRIPLAPNTFLESELLGVISLKGPSGNIWRANLVLDSDGLCFVNGWKEFSIDHHLESGDFLVFRYDGHSQFSVLVFDTTECAKKSAFYACPGSTLVVESDNAALDIDANDTLHPHVGDNERNNAIDTLQYNELALCIVGTKTLKEKHVESKKKKGNDKSQQKCDEEMKEKVKNTKDEDNQEKYAPKHAEKLTQNKEVVKVNDAFPQFCILISPEEITGKLRIPLAPNTFLESELLGVISLKGPSGNIWRANLVLDSDGLCFVNGWKEFSIDHHLESGDFLVFRYDGHSQFSVLVFDTTECAKKSAFYACPGSTLVVENENAALDIDANDTLHPYVGDNEGSNAIDTLQYNELALCIDGAKTPKVAVAEHDRSINGAHASQHDIQENGSLPKFPGSSRKAKGGLFGDSFWAPVDAVLDTDSDDTLENYERVNEGNHAAGNVQGNERTLACAKNTANDIEQEEGESSRKTKDRWSKDPFGTSQEVRSSRLNSMKDSSSTIFGRSDEVPSCGKFVTPMANTINKMKIVPQQDKDVAKIPEPKVFISQRLVITEKDKENPLKRATRLHSNYPFTLQMMKASHVYPAFFMIIPSEFVRKYLPKVNTKMTLWDHQGRQWRVNYVYHKSRGAFCRGWGAFVIANNIEKDDICLFELFHENNIKVGVFGVAQETTPCIPS